MAERKAVNKYYPPEWTPKMGSINKFRGTHALRERARKLHMGILIVRFEMPYNIWCDGCGNHIGMGVRYNAEKTKVGMYYTTPIYKFRMKCHLCPSHFEMQTDPQNLDYTVLNGARRQERRWNPDENEQVAPEEKDVTKKLAVDAMYRLEHGAEDKAKAKALVPKLAEIEEHQKRWRDDYSLNKLLRQKFREEKKSLKIEEEKNAALLAKSSLSVTLLPEDPEDVKLAGLLKLMPTESFEKKQQMKRKEIISRPLFNESPVLDSKKTNSKTADTSSKSNLLKKILYTKKNNTDKSFTASHLGVLKKRSTPSSGNNAVTVNNLNSNNNSLNSKNNISGIISKNRNSEIKNMNSSKLQKTVNVKQDSKNNSLVDYNSSNSEDEDSK